MKDWTWRKRGNPPRQLDLMPSRKLRLGRLRSVGSSQRLGCNADAGIRLDLANAHPQDATPHFENRRAGTFFSTNLHAFKYFLHLAGTRGVSQLNPVAGLPW